MTENRQAHWQDVYSKTGENEVSWYQESPTPSLELIDRIGSHHAPLGTEACNQEDHFEGWMVAAGSGPLSNHTLRALIVARGNLPTGTSPAGVFGSLDGDLIQCT